jgi:DNA-binding IclR family transcriptional regulator
MLKSVRAVNSHDVNIFWERPKIMSSLANAFNIIEHVVAEQVNGLSFTEILQRSNLPRSSAHRLLKELTSLNVLTYDSETKMYRGGFSLAALGAQVTSNLDIRQRCRPALKALHDALGNVVTLSVCGEDSGIYIDKIEPQDFGLRLHSEIGKSFPLHCTAMGKVHLAHGPESLRSRVLSGQLEAHTEATITDPEDLLLELERVRAQGYAIDDEEISRGLTCIGAPIYDLNGDVVAALSLTAPSHVYESGIPEDVITAVQVHAKQASLI